MRNWTTEELIATDKRFVWHPFTNMREWCAPGHEPLVLVAGHGAILRDSRGREYIDGNSSIWTNIHGHNHPHINAAIRAQLERVAHTSFLGFTNPGAIQLAAAIVDLLPAESLTRVFYSDDGSTGIEVAVRIAAQYWQLRGIERHAFVVFDQAYHGDTAGAAALGAATMFRSPLDDWKFPVRRVRDAETLNATSARDAERVAAVVIEPLVQAAAGIRLWPSGTLRAVREWCHRHGALLIADEVMTGFGRTGRMFAIEHENVVPDVIVLGKGLTGGYLPLAMTVVTDEIFSRFDGSVAEGRAFPYGHSYTGNALGCAAAKASLEVFANDNVLENLQPKIKQMRRELAQLDQLKAVAEVRQCGFVAGVELRETEIVDVAAKVCLAARGRGLLTRPIRNIIVLMPPLCITPEQLSDAIVAIRDAIVEVCGQ